VARPNVVLVTLDTTRADHIGAYGYRAATTPHLDALASRGALFENAATTAPLTLPAHASILTGMYPTHHGVRVNGYGALARAQVTLAEVLAAEGYETGAFLGAFVLDGRWGLGQGFAAYDDHFDLKKYRHLDLGTVQRPGDQVVDAALSWLGGRRERPFFAWIHLYDAHTPYEPPEPFRSAYAPRGPAGMYDGEIAFADQQVGRVVSWLRAQGLEEKTVVVVVGDHGEGLGSHGEGTHGYYAYDYALRVPFLVAAPLPGLGGRRLAPQVSLVDVFPTVLALCGLPPRAGVHGRSLVPLLFRPRPAGEDYAYAESMTPHVQYGWSPLYALRSARYKLIKAPRPELYDVVADPGETTNVIARHSAVADAMMARLDHIVATTGQGAPAPETADLDRESVAALAALGYIGTPAVPRTSPGLLADPKDKLAVFTAVQQAGERIVQDDYRGAAEALEAALREEPAMPQARLMLGTAYAELGRRGEAKVEFDRVLKDDPRSVQGLVGLANVLQDEGRLSDVIALARRTLSLDDRNTQAYTLLGEAYAARHQPREALPHLEKAVEIQPKLTRNRLTLAGCLIELREYARAEAALREILEESPRFPLAHFNLGLAYEGLGRPEDARRAYAAEVEAYPRVFQARFNLARLLFRLGDRAGSAAHMREVARLAPERAEGPLFLARGLLATGAGLDEVQGLVERGLSLARTPDLQALGWYLMADVQERRGRPQAVAEALRRANAYRAQAGPRGAKVGHGESD
jgi:arylsulfatase A-like enzyme/tetratricopeptide (TPR) repeat protein